MEEVNGNTAGSGQGHEYQPRHDTPAQGQPEYQPRHAAPQLEDELMEVLALAADQHRYAEMQRQYEAEYAIDRRRLFAHEETPEDEQFVSSQYLLIANSLGRQASAKAYADGLRAQIYYVPADGVWYQGRHRKEDRAALPKQDEIIPVEEPVPPEQQDNATTFDTPAPTGEEASNVIDAEPKLTVENEQYLREIEEHLASNRERMRSRSGVTLLPLPTYPGAPPPEPPKPPAPSASQEAGSEPEPPPGFSSAALPPIPRNFPESRGLGRRLRAAWHAGWTALKRYDTHPGDRHHGRRAFAQGAAILAIYGALATGAILTGHGPSGDWSHIHAAAPAATAAPQPYTAQYFDTLQPQGYHGESHEWGALANQVGEPQATPELLKLIADAQQNGLLVQTWGDTSSSNWGIEEVTAKLADGSYKSYTDTPHTLALLQWYAALNG